MVRVMKVAKFLRDELVVMTILFLIIGGGVAASDLLLGVEFNLIPWLIGSLIGTVAFRCFLLGWGTWVLKKMSRETSKNP